MRGTNNKVRYQEGQWFAVPLNCGGYALGLAARGGTRTHAALGYFFSQRYSSAPSESDTFDKVANLALLIAWFSDLGIVHGEWPLVQTKRLWVREEWPMPKFGRINVDDDAWVVEYADSANLHILEETPCSVAEARQLPKDAVWGAKAVQNWLSRQLCP